MNKLKAFAPALLLSVLSACSTSGGNSEPEVIALTDDDMVCKRIKSTGSHIDRTVCKSKDQIAREERESKQELRRIQLKSAARKNDSMTVGM